jgi:hypothetical protein
MASFTSRLAGWAAGRLKGEKARKKTMEFVDDTGVGKLLGLVGDAALLGGAGKLAGMGAKAVGAKMGFGGVGAGAGAGAGAAPTGVGATVRTAGSNLPIPESLMTASGRAGMGAQMGNVANAGMVSQPLSMADKLARGAQGVGSYIAKKPELAAGALKEFSSSRQAAANRDIQRQQMEQGQRQFDETLGLRKRDEEREVERQRRIAEMLAPLFQRIAGGQR